ncbi:arginine N-succinyltransferase [Oceanisphaera litoralis]|uniref:arginine N-succinyltransferase n=1 Tax=Oceanisphaera litoralis TaxID=225144 RepID=UPI00195CA803|nr:arginine N-succinyltransferase [Oceanisphaera litoralis]MBM7456378.1 arginine N-succinyltransferase [Oceanisphaera litoralis]
MLVIRPIEQRDFPALKQIAIESGHGFTSLPVNDELLQNKIDYSMASFASRPAGKGECLYFFVAEDSDTGEVLGTSALDAAVGLSSPFYTYLLGKQVHSSPRLGIYNVVDTLTLTNDYTGTTELCTLFLREQARHGLNGRLLSKCRFLFLAEFSELFDHRILAEMRGVSDDSGSSPFWSWLQEHFFSMDFPTVDYLTGIGQKGFIADLMPKYPIYVNLLSKEARAVIGKTHDQTRPALHLLEEEGFSWRGYVDIFDAGPSVECDLRQIRTVRNSRQLKVHVGEPVNAGMHLISNTRFDGFRALIGDVAVNEEKVQAVMTEEVARLLMVEDGDTVRLVEM